MTAHRKPSPENESEGSASPNGLAQLPEAEFGGVRSAHGEMGKAFGTRPIAGQVWGTLTGEHTIPNHSQNHVKLANFLKISIKYAFFCINSCIYEKKVVFLRSIFNQVSYVLNLTIYR